MPYTKWSRYYDLHYFLPVFIRVHLWFMENKMNIVVVTPYFIPHRGGIGTIVHEVGKRLVRMGHEVTVICPDYGGEYLEELDGIKVVRVLGSDILSRAGINFPLISASMRRWLKHFISGADIVHIHGFLFLSSLYAISAAKRYRKPIVLTEHVGHVRLGNALFNMMEVVAIHSIGKSILHDSEVVITYNSRVMEEVVNMGVEPWRIRFVKNSVDTDFFKPVSGQHKNKIRQELGLPVDKIIAIFVGRFVEKKGVIPLLNCKRKNYHLLMIGDGIKIPDTVLRDGNITFKRPMPQQELIKYYHASDIFVLPSLYEGFPLTVHEAMACGLPMVLGNDSAYKDYLDPSRYEAVEQNPDSIEKGIQNFVMSKSRRLECGNYGRQKVKEDTQWDETASMHLGIYREVIARYEVKKVWTVPAFDLATLNKLPSLEKVLLETRGNKVLDAGCGSGFLGNYLFGIRKRVFCDRSLNNLIAARTRAYFANIDKNIWYVCCDLSHLPFKDSAFKVTLCSEVLEHLPSVDTAVSELSRCTSKNGDIVVTVPQWPHRKKGLVELLNIKTVHDRAGLEYHYHKGFTAGTLNKMFSNEGFFCRDIQGFSNIRQRFIIDIISLLHLLYQRIRFGKIEWEWSTMLDLEKSFVFSIYRRLFFLFKILCGKKLPGRLDECGGITIRYSYTGGENDKGTDKNPCNDITG
ncbi:MAG: glycosyltransferase [wastewater metagenome]|nr:glycosyltransferase [Candidatus Loosdrechtia aerotolerans]